MSWKWARDFLLVSSPLLSSMADLNYGSGHSHSPYLVLEFEFWPTICGGNDSSTSVNNLAHRLRRQRLSFQRYTKYRYVSRSWLQLPAVV